MTFGDADEPDAFAPTFPAYVPFRITVEGMEYLRIGMASGNGRQVPPCIPLFTDHERCLIFGKSCHFPMCAVMENARLLADFLEDQAKRGARTVALDPQSRDEARGGLPIYRAIELLIRLSDPGGEASSE